MSGPAPTYPMGGQALGTRTEEARRSSALDSVIQGYSSNLERLLRVSHLLRSIRDNTLGGVPEKAMGQDGRSKPVGNVHVLADLNKIGAEVITDIESLVEQIGTL